MGGRGIYTTSGDASLIEKIKELEFNTPHHGSETPPPFASNDSGCPDLLPGKYLPLIGSG
jgi:hypothetical protein